MLNPTRICKEREGTPGASYDRTRREQESREDREARLDRQRLRTNDLTPGQRWVPQLAFNITLIEAILPLHLNALTIQGYRPDDKEIFLVTFKIVSDFCSRIEQSSMTLTNIIWKD